MKHRVFLAWLQLAKEKQRLLAAVGGIAFAVVLMLVQAGLKVALLETAGLLYSHLDDDIALINPEYQYAISPKPVSKRRIYQALGFDGVRSIAWLDFGLAPWKNPVTRQERTIYVVGFKPTRGVFDFPLSDLQINELRNPDTVLFDAAGRPEFGPVVKEFNEGHRVVTEVAGRRVQVVGLFNLGTSFGVDGTIITSDITFHHILPASDPELANLGLVMLRPGADPDKVRAQMAAALPHDVSLLTHEELVDLERVYWNKNTPIGFTFNLGLIMNFFVGSIIVYQILYTDVSVHLNEYATLKALGYSDRKLFWIVMQEAIILSMLGFVPGLAVSAVVYRITTNATLLPMHLTAARIITIYFVAFFMCALAGAFATTKLRHADPAEIF